jgi:hypothetical protein
MKQSRILAAMDRLNPLVVRLLHTPLFHWLASPGLMTITLNGRRTGRRARFPVGYHDQGDAVVVLVSNAESRQWWRNFRDGWPATLCIHGKAREMTGQVLEPGSEEYRMRVGRSFCRADFIPRMFEIDFDREQGLSDGQMCAIGEHAAVVRFEAAQN